MKRSILPVKIILCLSITFCLIHIPSYGQNDTKRIKRPKKHSKIESADAFVDHSFDLYHKVFVYDSLNRSGYDISEEEDDIIMESMKQDLDSLWAIAPDLLDDLSNNPISLKKGKAVLNLNKAKKAIKTSLVIVKNYLKDDDEQEH